MFFSRRPIKQSLNTDIPLSTPIEDISFTVFDTETTGFQVAAKDRMIELAAVQVKGFEVIDFDIFQSYANPERQISREIIELTGINNEMVENKPSPIEVIHSFFDFAIKNESSCLVGHYVSFDILTLKSELKREKYSLKRQPTIDTLDLIGFISPSYDMRDLHRYARIFGTRIYERHTAKGDALTTAYLFVELLQLFKERGYHTWGELLDKTDNQSRYF